MQRWRAAIFATAILFVLSAVADAQNGSSTTVVPGNASWLGDSSGRDGTPSDFSSYLPFSYMILADGGVAVPRVIVARNESCPNVVADSFLYAEVIPHVKLRAVGDNTLPHAFPIKVCETKLKTAAQKEAWSNGQIYFNGTTNTNITVTDSPQRFLLISDIGLRVKPSNLGLGTCLDSPYSLYGIPQCDQNFTQADLTEPVEGVFQPLDSWPLQSLMTKAAEQNPDVVIIMGDYLYRQGPCPMDDCAGVNAPPNFAASDLPDNVVANFLPGNWGDNWFGWFADFLYPARQLLATAPIIAIRGNHENCIRGGHGYFLLLSQEDYPNDAKAGDMCLNYTEPFRVPFANEQFLINDDSAVEPLDGGIDHLEFVEGACPPPPQDGEPPIVPLVQDRYQDPSQKAAEIDEQLAIYAAAFEKIQNMSELHETNFYVSHRPVFGVACNDTTMVTLDWTMQESLRPTTLDRVTAMIGGHMHWLEVLTFVDHELPVQLVVGHGGTKQLENYVNQRTIPGLKLEIGKFGIEGTVERGLTDSSRFGFAMMDRNFKGDYDVTFLSLETTTNDLVHIEFPLVIRQGPRVNASSGAATSSALKLHSAHVALAAVICAVLRLTVS